MQGFDEELIELLHGFSLVNGTYRLYDLVRSVSKGTSVSSHVCYKKELSLLLELKPIDAAMLIVYGRTIPDARESWPATQDEVDHTEKSNYDVLISLKVYMAVKLDSIRFYLDEQGFREQYPFHSRRRLMKRQRQFAIVHLIGGILIVTGCALAIWATGRMHDAQAQGSFTDAPSP